MKRVIAAELVERRVAPPFDAVHVADVKDWVPDHEQAVAVTALMRLIKEETPVEYRTPGATVHLADLAAGREFVDDLERDYPSWFE